MSRLCILKWLFASIGLFCLTVAGQTQAQMPVSLTIFLDQDTLTIYVPGSQAISLQGFGFQYIQNGQSVTYPLQHFPAFSIPLNAVPAPLCFRLERDLSQRSLPLECQGVPVLRQGLPSANVFWYDTMLANWRALLVIQGDIALGVCASGQSTCVIPLAQPTSTPSPTIPPTDAPTPTPSPTIVPPTSVVVVPPAPQPIVYSSPVYGSLEPSSSRSGVDYVLTAYAGESFTIRLRFEGSYNPTVILMNAAGEALAYSDFEYVQDGGLTWRDAVIADFTAPVSGSYTIRVMEWGQVSFSFLLRVDLRVPPTIVGTDVIMDVPILSDGAPEYLPPPTP